MEQTIHCHSSFYWGRGQLVHQIIDMFFTVTLCVLAVDGCVVDGYTGSI